ncbi:MAG: hypothetical protein Fur009_2590 [Candidatus Microgenomates bacterium]
MQHSNNSNRSKYINNNQLYSIFTFYEKIDYVLKIVFKIQTNNSQKKVASIKDCSL